MKHAGSKTALVAILFTVVILAAVLGGGLWYTRSRPLMETVDLQNAEISQVSLNVTEAIFAEDGFQGWDHWSLRADAGDEACGALLDLLNQGVCRASLRNLLGGRSSISGGGADRIDLSFTISEQEFVSFALCSDGQLYLYQADSGLFTYTQTSESLFSALCGAVKTYGSPDT